MWRLVVLLVALLPPQPGQAQEIIDMNTADGFLLRLDQEFTLGVRNPVDVMLFGLDGTGPQGAVLEPEKLQLLLRRTLPTRQPRVVGAGSQHLHVTYELDYRVWQASPSAWADVHRLVAGALRPTPDPGHFLVTLDATLEQHLESLVDSELRRLRAGPGRQRVVVLSLDLGRLRPAEAPKPPPWSYRYSYRGAEAAPSTQNWISSGHSVWVDLAASSVERGSNSSFLGAVTARSIPRLQVEDSGRRPSPVSSQLVHGLTQLVASAVIAVFCPDLARARVEVGERLLLRLQPLPCRDAAGTTADGMHQIEAAELRHKLAPLATGPVSLQLDVQQLALPGAAPGDSAEAHGLRLAAVLEGSQRREPALAGQPPFLDTGRLLRLLQRADLVSQRSAGVSLGQQLAVLYVLTLGQAPAGLTLEHRELYGVAVDGDAALVLQTGDPVVPTGIYAGASARSWMSADASGRESLRHAVAAVLELVGAVLPPYLQADPLTGEPVRDWLWAVGCHPFGPLGAPAGEFSALFVDTVVRNTIIRRASRAYQLAREAARRLRWLQQAYGLPERSLAGGPLPPDLPDLVFRVLEDAAELRLRLSHLEEQFRTLGGALFAMDLERSFRLAAQISLRADSFAVHAREKLDAMAVLLECVGWLGDQDPISWTVRGGGRVPSSYLVLAGALVMLTAAGAAFVWIKNRRAGRAEDMFLGGWKRD